MRLIAIATAALLSLHIHAIDFSKEIKPLLQDNCLKCHNSEKSKGDLNLETLKLSEKGGENGPAIKKGNIKDSLLIQRITLPEDHDDIMPPKGGPLKKESIQLLEAWIAAGAEWPEGAVLKTPVEQQTNTNTSAKEISLTAKPTGHRFLATDKGIVAIVGYDGKLEWKHPARAVHDLKMLSNGNVLFQVNQTTVVEVDPKTNKKVFEYDSALMNGNKDKKIEVHSFSRLENGNTIIAESGASRLIEVNKAGKIIKQFSFQIKKPHPHRDTRLVTVTNKGNYLVAHEGDGMIKEYTPSGQVVWEYSVPLFDRKPAAGHGPEAWGNQAFCALRLPNGNTLIATGNGHSVIEVTPDKQIVWHLTQNELPGITLAWVTTLELLPNGNYVIGNCHAGPDNPQLIEINKNKEVIWTFKDFQNFGNSLSNSHILDAADDLTFFKEQVHPILEKNCLKCHGHNEIEMKGGLWLESRQNALKGGDIGKIINFENLADSVILKHINWVDDEHQMPPKKKMTDEEISVLTEWVARKLPFDPYTEKIHVVKNEINEHTRQFWSFLPINKPQVPEVSNKQWASNDIDNFILSKLEANGLTPNPAADRTALIRRAYYDLIGLPPTPAQINAFIDDKSPNAYENVIDKLLASKHYGEKWGRHWLDIVRFAETNSYERDGHKPEAWQYRQWVINSFNQDKPYDRMILEQLAGDEIKDANRESITATGYYRLGVWDDEPADKLQATYDEYDDIVKTTADVFMGMSVGCARCHNHKIDPILMKDYYTMLSFFHNVKPYSRGGYENSILTNVISEEKKQQITIENAKRAETRKPILKEMKKLEDIILNSSIDDIQRSDMRNVTFKFYRETWDKLPDFDMHKEEESGSVPGNWFDISKASRKISFGYVFEGDLDIEKTGTYTFHLNSDDGSELFIDGKSIVKYDGIHGMDKVQKGKVNLKEGTHKIRLNYFQKEHGYGLSVLWDGGKGKSKGKLRPLSKPDKNDVKFTDIIKNRDKAVSLMGLENYNLYKKLENELNNLADITPAEYVLSVREHGNIPKDTFVLRRGSAHSIGPQVEPGFLTVLTDKTPEVKATEFSTGRRLAFAKWLVEENPLTARVMANRIWQYHFGRGIVRSPNNFGMMGDEPTHPALLNYLAASFKENNWSIKKLHRLIMFSSAYKMSSHDNPLAYDKDPANNFFWRFDMRRLTGEEIRDSILSVIGKLDTTYGGPSVFPKISAEVLAGQSSIKWKVNTPESHQYRRSVYTFVMRSLIHPLVESFDGANTDASCDVRFETTQPTQALTMMNGELLNKSAELMAQHIQEIVGKDLNKQMEFIWHKATGYPVKPEEVQVAMEFMAKAKALNMTDEHALQQLCLIILNLNKFIYLD